MPLLSRPLPRRRRRSFLLCSRHAAHALCEHTQLSHWPILQPIRAWTTLPLCTPGHPAARDELKFNLQWRACVVTCVAKLASRSAEPHAINNELSAALRKIQQYDCCRVVLTRKAWGTAWAHFVTGPANVNGVCVVRKNRIQNLPTIAFCVSHEFKDDLRVFVTHSPEAVQEVHTHPHSQPIPWQPPWPPSRPHSSLTHAPTTIGSRIAHRAW